MGKERSCGNSQKASLGEEAWVTTVRAGAVWTSSSVAVALTWVSIGQPPLLPTRQGVGSLRIQSWSNPGVVYASLS